MMIEVVKTIPQSDLETIILFQDDKINEGEIVFTPAWIKDHPVNYCFIYQIHGK